MDARRILVIQTAALGWELLTENQPDAVLSGMKFRPADSIFPAVTCPVQATMRTALPPAQHGMTYNGHYVSELRRPMFWEQSSALVHGRRIWSDYRKAGGRVGMLFWQQSLGEEVDVLLSPAPIHTHGGGMVEAVYSKPEGLYDELRRELGARFKLSSYWGPLAGAASTRWIARATAAVMRRDDAPGLLFTYLPHLDYDLQRYGPDSRQAKAAMSALAAELDTLVAAAKTASYDVLIFGDYAIGPVGTPPKRNGQGQNAGTSNSDTTNSGGPLYPNRILREAGLMAVRQIRGRQYPDFHRSRAFAVVDHEVAMVYLHDRSDATMIAEQFANRPGYSIADELLYTNEAPGSGESRPVVLLADSGSWFAYPWWKKPREAPDYATHIDIHNKPGYDPCELFFGWHPMIVSTDGNRIAGSHGRVDASRQIAWASTVEFDTPIENLCDLASALQNHLNT